MEKKPEIEGDFQAQEYDWDCTLYLWSRGEFKYSSSQGGVAGSQSSTSTGTWKQIDDRTIELRTRLRESEVDHGSRTDRQSKKCDERSTVTLTWQDGVVVSVAMGRLVMPRQPRVERRSQAPEPDCWTLPIVPPSQGNAMMRFLKRVLGRGEPPLPPGAAGRIPSAGAFAFRPHGSSIASDGSLWHVPGLGRTRQLPDRLRAARWLGVAPDGRTLAAYGKHPEFNHFETVILDLSEPGAPIRELLDSTGAVIRVGYPFYAYGTRRGAFSPDGKRFASPLELQSQAWIFDVATGRCVAKTAGHGTRRAVDSDDNEFDAPIKVRDLAFSPDGRALATLGESETICFWDAATGAPLSTVGAASEHCMAERIAFTPDGRFVVASSQVEGIAIWDSASAIAGTAGTPVLRIAQGCISFALLAGRNAVVAGRSFGTLRAFDLATGREIPRAGGPVDPAADPVIFEIWTSPTGPIVAAGMFLGTPDAAREFDSVVLFDAGKLWP